VSVVFHFFSAIAFCYLAPKIKNRNKLTISFCFGTFDDGAVDKTQNRSNSSLPSRGWPAGRPTRERRSCMHGRPADRERQRERKKRATDTERESEKEEEEEEAGLLAMLERICAGACHSPARTASQTPTPTASKQANHSIHTKTELAFVWCAPGVLFLVLFFFWGCWGVADAVAVDEISAAAAAFFLFCLLQPVSSSISIVDSSEQDPFPVDYCFSLFTLQPWVWFHK